MNLLEVPRALSLRAVPSRDNAQVARVFVHLYDQSEGSTSVGVADHFPVAAPGSLVPRPHRAVLEYLLGLPGFNMVMPLSQFVKISIVPFEALGKSRMHLAFRPPLSYNPIRLYDAPKVV
jgi:hypothetical protein